MMNSLKMSVFAFAMSISMAAVAASTMDSTTGAEGDLNRPSSNEANRMQDCSIRNGNDRLLCEKEMRNDTSRSLRNDNSRINRNNDGNMIDYRKSRDTQSIDREINNSQPLGSTLGDVPLNSNPSTSGSDNSSTGNLNGL